MSKTPYEIHLSIHHSALLTGKSKSSKLPYVTTSRVAWLAPESGVGGLLRVAGSAWTATTTLPGQHYLLAESHVKSLGSGELDSLTNEIRTVYLYFVY